MRKTIGWSVSICAIAAGFALAMLPATSASAAPAAPAAPSAMTGAASRAAYTTFPGRLYSVKAISASDAWAVGLSASGSLIVHWNGSAWSQSLIGSGYFTGVGASSAKDVWAVGGTNWFSPTQPLAMHWNGKSWAQVSTANPPGGGVFDSVAAISASNAWAVGIIGAGPGSANAQIPLIEHWNGKRWTIQNFQVPADGGGLGSVAALSPSDVWAVGAEGPANQGTGKTLIEHWNGKTWIRVPSPNEGAKETTLSSVTVASSDNAWAVGSYTAADGSYRTLALYWNGVHWTVVPSQTPGADGQLNAVTATWTHNIWAVGIRNPTRCGNGGPQCQTLVEHWNSTRWTLIASPNPPAAYLNALWGISGASRTDIWAVGSTDYGSTLIEHWNGSSWS